MKGIDDLDYYELLEIPSSATPAEIERAYRLAQQTWADGSLALYSLFENADAAAIRSRLDEAHGVLLDPEARRRHDRERIPKQVSPSTGGMGSKGSPSPPGFDHGNPGSPGPTAEASGSAGGFPEMWEDEPLRDRGAGVESGLAGVVGGEVRSEGDEAFEEDVFEEQVFEEDGPGDFDGVRLRRARLFRGYEIDEISHVTKVSGTHLRNIEEEKYAELPADVYVRGFVTAYARTIGLDPQRVVPGYMARLQESRNDGARSRFLGRR